MFTKKKMEELDRINPEEIHSINKNNIIIILDDVRSMHNVGSVFRTCDAFAAEAIYLCGYTPTPPHRDIHKTALGATETVKWQHFEKTIDAVVAAQQAGHKIFAVEQTHNSTALNQFTWYGEKIALVFGNEVSGVNEQVLRVADGSIEIPQWGSKHSLNISVSVGIVLWEMVRNAHKM
ncbi:MAG TPA: RNA methyltransferase [Flavipsychrobacter sp.]|nr:RNA methyltransferase [Flavipsychrobacter sp.]